MQLRYLIFFIVLLVSISFGKSAFAQGLVGNLVSLDGSIEHRFSPSGDYTGKITDSGVSADGVYVQQDNTCWRTSPDGTKQYGDLLLYIGQVQCCMSVAAISDKYALTQIWESGTGIGYSLCRNQVYKKANATDF